MTADYERVARVIRDVLTRMVLADPDKELEDDNADDRLRPGIDRRSD